MPIRVLAAFLKVDIRAADELIDRDQLDELERIQPGAFSAVAFYLPHGRTVIAYNSINAELGRTNSDLAHELAHILLNHDVRELQHVGGHTLLTCNPEQEEEANWLAGCLLLPRALLLREAYAGSDPATIARKHDVSLQMARFRLNASGVLLQVQRAKSIRTKR